MAYDEIKPSGVTEQTPGNILLGAGTIHLGLKYTGSAWNFEDSLIGATSGGNKFTITPEIKTVEADGAYVKVKGLQFKQGETASMEINLLEITEQTIRSAVIGDITQSDIDGYKMIKSKPMIEEGDYFENIAFVGRKTDGDPIIIIMENALCTSGLELEPKSKEESIGKYTFECHQDVNGDLLTLPYKIYYPE